MKTLAKYAVGVLFALSFQACGTGDAASELNQAKGGGGSTAGGKCQVTSGPNKGKTGTYDEEGWCMGDWGGTECKGSDGQSKCKDAAKIVIDRPIIIKPIATPVSKS